VIKFDAQSYMKAWRQVLWKAMYYSLKFVEQQANATVPVDTGRLKSTIHVVEPFWITPYLLRGAVAAGGRFEAPYAVFMERGTGVHMAPAFKQESYFSKETGVEIDFNSERTEYPGGTGWYIIPRNAKFMHFVDRSGNDVFTKGVSGVEPLHWLKKAFELSKPFIIRQFKSVALKFPHANFFVTTT